MTCAGRFAISASVREAPVSAYRSDHNVVADALLDDQQVTELSTAYALAPRRWISWHG